MAEILIGLNMLEVSNYHLTSRNEQFTNMGIPEKQEKNFIEVEQSKTDFKILRKDIAHYLLKNLSENIDVEYPQKIFEIGKVFNIEPKTDRIEEKEYLAIALAPGNFTELKQIFEYLFNMLKIKISISEPKEIPAHFIEGRTIEIKINDSTIGFLGEIHPKILKNWKIKMPVAVMEICLDKLFDR